MRRNCDCGLVGNVSSVKKGLVLTAVTAAPGQLSTGLRPSEARLTLSSVLVTTARSMSICQSLLGTEKQPAEAFYAYVYIYKYKRWGKRWGAQTTGLLWGISRDRALQPSAVWGRHLKPSSYAQSW